MLVMGVSGAGKTTLGQRLAQALGAKFIEGDDFHAASSIEKMRGGEPLTDLDRSDWILSLAHQLFLASASSESAVLACSALKQAYREVLSASCPGLRTVWLRGSRELIASRLSRRRHPFMPASLLESQFEILEAPVGAIILDANASEEALLSTALQELMPKTAVSPKTLARV